MSATTINPEDLLIPLASAHGDVEVVRQLVEGQYGKRILQLRMMADRWAVASPAVSGTSRLPEWYSLLAKVQRAAPRSFRALLLDPDTARCLEIRDGDPGAMARIAVAAAILGRLPATVAVPVEGGKLFLPGLGTAAVGDAAGPDRAVVHVTADGVTVAAGGADVALPRDLTTATDHWRPVRWLSAGKEAKLKVRFAADGPLSDAFSAMCTPDSPAPDSPAPQNEGDWQGALADAWQVLESGHPVHAASIAAGARAIIPLSTPGDGNSVSATLEGTFGAIALSMPPGPEFFAVALIHEFQHAKLAAALDLVRLYTADDRVSYYAPWRPDPRPLGALLQGIYAHLGVAQFWGIQRRLADARNRLLAHVEFVRWRDDTWQACKEIVGVPALTAAGTVFVNTLLGELDRFRAEEVPPEARTIADLIARDHGVSWRLRNLEVDQETARYFADAWLNNKDPSAFPAESVRRRAAPRTVPAGRIRLLYRHLDGSTADARDEGTPADLLYAQGNYRDALDAYEKRAAEDPGDLDAWAGMALSASAGNGVVLGALTAVPEVVAEIYRHAASGNPGLKRPRQLAQWLSMAG